MRNPLMTSGQRMRTDPIPVTRTTRPSSHRVLTSMEPGKMVPIMAIPLLREDSCIGAFRVAFEMKETVEVLMNAVHARVLTYLVPKTALDRFSGLDAINKSYAGLPVVEGGDVTPWFETMVAPAHGANAIFKKMGIHARPGTTINTEYIEAYNQIWNFRAKNRSPDIPLRTRLDATLAPAFWAHQNFAHIVPDFDQAIIDGEVTLNVVNARMPVRGLGVGNHGTALTNPSVLETDKTTATTYPQGHRVASGTPGAGETNLFIKQDIRAGGIWPDIYAELQDNGITVSLSNIDMARKTQAFAELRRQFNGHTDEYIIDLLMDGITVPDQAWEQPILLGDQMVNFGMSKRYATDGESLTESVVNGMTMIEQRIVCPKVPMGGVIMMVVEVTPEQLWERQQDPYLHATTVDHLPAFLRDTLDPEKVQIVKNEEIDLDHDQPTEVFGYAPLNHQWAKSIPRIGGKFYRPEVDAGFDEDRQRIWAVETQNPVLSADFYLCTIMHQKPFVVTTGDNFEVLLRGDAAISGITVFGGALIEATNDYAKIVEKQPTERLDKDA